MSKKKKVTAPLSYDPGKGRPKEYLAYLNWQEMEALRRLNGNNTERGPMGIPSFAITTGTTTGTTVSTGVGAGSGVGDREGSGSDSGSREGGSTTSPGATASTTGTTAGTQSSDTAAQQAAETKNAADAAKTSALTEDARKAGIASINVGPMQTPVQIGSGAISQAVASAIPTMPGGGGMGQYNARRGSSTMAVGPTSGVDAFNNIATGSRYGTPPSAARAYDSLESDLNRRALTRVMTSESSAPSISSASSAPSITPNAPGGVFGPRISMDRTYYPDAPVGATVGPRRYSTPDLSESAGYASEFDGIGGPTDRQVTDAIKNAAYNAYSAVSSYFSDPSLSPSYDVANLPKLEVATPDVRNAQSMRAVGGLGIASLPGSVGSSSVQTDPRYDSAQRDLERGGTATKVQMANIDRMGPFNTSHDLGKERIISVENVPEVYEGRAEQQISDVEESYRNQPGEGVYSVGEIVREGEFSYPTNPDGTPITAEDIAAMPYSTQAEIMDKARFERMTDEEYKLTPEQKQRVAAVKVATAPTRGIVVKAILSGIGGLAGLAENIPGGVGKAASTVKRGAQSLSDPAEALADYLRLDPLQRQQFADRAGTGYTTGAGTTYAGRIPAQEPGGKGNDFGPSSYGRYPGYSDVAYTPPSAAEDTGRPYQYYLWDLGVGIPSPGDPDYNEYQKYRRNRGSSTDV